MRSSAINTKMPRFYATGFTFLLGPYFSLAATWDDAAEEREAFAAMLQRVDSDALYGPQRLEMPLEKGDVLDREFADFRAHERSQRWVQDGRGGNARVLQHRIPEETSGSAETARNTRTEGADDVVLAEAVTNDPLPTSANCTWRYYDQPLNHFAGKTATSKFRYLQRACFYEGFLAPTTSATASRAAGSSAPPAPAGAFPVVFFYVGNESPLEVYINNTGLMWNLGQQLNGALIFAEHRYEGKSVPRNLNNTRGCLAYASSKQALADYALLVETLRATDARYSQSKFIAVGGSYGGMLASWARQKYPQSFAGAIAGSAPIHGIPKIFPQIQMDASAKVVTRGLSKPGGLSTDFCAENYLGAWVLLSWWLGAGGRGSSKRGNPGEEDAGKIIQETMGLCTAPGPKDALTLLGYLQAAFFLLAEGNYPFPSNYITGAVGGNTSAKLPAWPMRAACSGLLDKKFLQIKRDRKAPAGVAKFELSVSSGGSSRSSSDEHEEEISSTTAQEDQEQVEHLQHVDWPRKKLFRLGVSGGEVRQLSPEDVPFPRETVVDLLRRVADGVGVWYNVTDHVTCFDWQAGSGGRDWGGRARRSTHAEEAAPSEKAPVASTSRSFFGRVVESLRDDVNDVKERAVSFFGGRSAPAPSSSSRTMSKPPAHEANDASHPAPSPNGRDSNRNSLVQLENGHHADAASGGLLAARPGAAALAAQKTWAAAYGTVLAENQHSEAEDPSTASSSSQDDHERRTAESHLRAEEALMDEGVCLYDSPDNSVPSAFSWEPTVCNDQMFLVNYASQGYGNDFYFPPSGPTPNNVTELYGVPFDKSIIGAPGGVAGQHFAVDDRGDVILPPPWAAATTTGSAPPPPPPPASPCSLDFARRNLFGLNERNDFYGQELLAYYGSPVGSGASNIVFSNGLLDPWFGGGVDVPADLPATEAYKGKYVYNVKNSDAKDSLVVALVELGAHHLDLMFPSTEDPREVKFIRWVESKLVRRWMSEWGGGELAGRGNDKANAPPAGMPLAAVVAGDEDVVFWQ